MLTGISRRLTKMAGFTMVELMIVIAIIGIIAVAVLSAINPIEQINKGKDTRIRSDASEMLGALERYYATDEHYPFPNNLDGTIGTTANEVASTLVAQSELKDSYLNRIGSGAGQSNLTINQGAGEQDLFVCFTPSSAQFLREAAKKSTEWQAATRPGWLTATTYCMP